MPASHSATRFVAFLRAINVGGRRVKMDRLREIFEDMGFENVETFIASGNVIFDARVDDAPVLEREIETRLHEALGYPVSVFLRSLDELAGIAGYRPFGPAEPGEGCTLSVAFLAAPPGDEARARLAELETGTDAFHVDGREVYWLCRGRTSDSNFSNAVLEKRLGSPATMRNATTVVRLAEKYPGSP